MGQPKKVSKHALNSRSASKLNAMLSLAKSEHPIADVGDNWDNDPYLLGVANGVVDLRTGTLRNGRREDKISLNTGVRFDPDAKAPRWETFVDEVFDGDAEVVDAVQRAVGYSISGDTSEDVFFLEIGDGSNGKTTFNNGLTNALGDYAWNMPFSTLERNSRASIPNDVAALDGRRFVTASEGAERSLLNEARIKALTGGDPITARHLFREFFTFNPVAKIWLATNHLPKVEDDSHGFWRRIRVIPFDVRFDGATADKGLEARLREEAEGILAWAIRGYLEYQRRGLGFPKAVTEATTAYRHEADQLSAFIDMRCVVHERASVRARNFFGDYRDWANSEGLGADEILTPTMFGRRMRERFQKDRDRHGTVYRGIGLRERDWA